MKRAHVGVIVCGCIYIALLTSVNAADLDVNSLIFKVSLERGESVSKVLHVSSVSGGAVFIQAIGVEGVSFSEDAFTLEAGQGKNIEITFNASALTEGVHVGSIHISKAEELLMVPVIFEIQSSDILFGANLDIPPYYSEVAPGEKILAQLKIFDLTAQPSNSDGIGSAALNLEYNVYSVANGELLASESETIIVHSEAQITKAVSLPQTLGEGDYVFSTLITYKSSISSVSRLFHVSIPQTSPMYFGIEMKTLWFVGTIALFFIGIILLFIYFIHDRDKIILDLKQYNSWEIERNKELLTSQATRSTMDVQPLS